MDAGEAKASCESRCVFAESNVKVSRLFSTIWVVGCLPPPTTQVISAECIIPDLSSRINASLSHIFAGRSIVRWNMEHDSQFLTSLALTLESNPTAEKNHSVMASVEHSQPSS